MHLPTSTHLEAAKRILHFVRGTLNHGIHFSPGPLTKSAFTEADWAGDLTDHPSTTGFWFFLAPILSHGLQRSSAPFHVLLLRLNIGP